MEQPKVRLQKPTSQLLAFALMRGLAKEATMRLPLIKALLMATLGITSANALANPCSGPIDVQTTQPKARPEFRPERQEEVKRRLLSESFGAITLGDSIMEGWGPRILESAFNQPTLNPGLVWMAPSSCCGGSSRWTGAIRNRNIFYCLLGPTI